MIFVTVGTSTFPFDRLMRCVDALDVSEQLVVQHGASGFVPRASIARQFMSYVDVVENMHRARVVVAHGGVGSILTAIHAGKRPLVVPRLRRYSEAVDDHQVGLARRLADSGIVILVDDLSELGAYVAAVPESLASATMTSDLADAVGEYVNAVLGPVCVENSAARPVDMPISGADSTAGG
jgi:UDP-N-acetylglucosamine transferase subunit ALG13